MKLEIKPPITVNHVKSIDKLMILCYNLLLLAGASYLVYYKDASAWLFALALVFGAKWSEKDDV